MIERLAVAGLALIDAVQVDLGPGLTTVTGETGAGKTMLVEALNLAVGERADSGLVREGADEARVTVEWRHEDDPVAFFERRVAADGRSKCLIDGRQVTVSALAEAADGLVDLHGQHEHQRLMHQRTHAEYLDRHAGPEALDLRERYVRALGCARAAARALADATMAEADRARLVDRLRQEIDEIEAADPQPEELEELEARLPVLRHAERLAEAVSAAYSALESSGEGPQEYAALDRSRAAVGALAGVHGVDPCLDGLAARLDALVVELDDIARSVRDYLDGLERDPDAYARAEARAYELRRLAERHGGSTSAVLDHLDDARRTLETLEGGDARREQVERELASALATLGDVGGRLSQVRRKVAQAFATAVQEEARILAMPDARFVVDISELAAPTAGGLADASPDGLDRVEFLFSANEGEAVRPLARVASGGELSRLMLAVKTALGSADTVGTLVFDEVDAGIGGQTAVAVADALRRLARDRQVIVITHLPQIAAAADHHLVVRKEVSGGRTVTSVGAVEAGDLEQEIARMLSGDSGSDASLAHARDLLAARRART